MLQGKSLTIAVYTAYDITLRNATMLNYSALFVNVFHRRIQNLGQRYSSN
jgi:hypothetical protein